MKDRVSRNPGAYKAMIPAGGMDALQNSEEFEIFLKRDDDPEVEGTPYNKNSVVPDDVAEAVCPGIEDPTPADVFRELHIYAMSLDTSVGEMGEEMKIIKKTLTSFESTQEEVRKLVDVCNVAHSASGLINYAYNFVAGCQYKFTKYNASYVNMKTKDASGAVIDSISLGAAPVIFTATKDAVTLQLFFGSAGSVDIEDLSVRVPVLEEKVENLQNLQDTKRNGELTDFVWTVGSINVPDGKDDDTKTNRIRTGFIPVTGYSATVVCDGGGSFIVCEYASNNVNSNLIARQGVASDWVTGKYTIQKDECKYIRIIARKTDNSSFVDENDVADLGRHFKLTQSFFAHRAIGRYVSPAKEEFYYSGDIEAYSSSNKLATLYSKWDALHEAYPNIVSEKTVLGVVGGKEIRSYRITPTPMSDSYRISRYSCDPLKVLYVSSVHGNERSISVDDFTMFKNLVENHKPSVLWNNCVFEVIPVANPVGYDADSRYNGNNVNINRNFPAGWVYMDKDVDQYNASGDEPGSEYETKVLMNFVKSHPDAFLVLNRHGTADWVQNGLAGYAASAYQSDAETIIASGTATDTALRDKYPEINVINPNNRIYSASHSDQFQGSFDMWFNSVGYHGYLLEYADRVGSGVTAIDNETVRRINIVGIANLLCDCVLNNREIIGNSNKLPGREMNP